MALLLAACRRLSFCERALRAGDWSRGAGALGSRVHGKVLGIVGLGAIGPGVGEGMAAAKACEAIGRNPKEAGLLTRTMLVGQAVAQTPSIFGLLVSFILLFKAFPESQALAAAMALLSAGICTGFGGIGPGIGNGMAAEGAVKWVARNTAYAGDLMRTMLVGTISELSSVKNIISPLARVVCWSASASWSPSCGRGSTRTICYRTSRWRSASCY